jgi:ABC-type Na+ efflux pump permease subunit
MGGHVAGEVASRLAVDAIQAFIEETAGADKNRTWPFPFEPSISVEGNRLKAAFRLANRQIANAMADSADLRGMATTASAVLAGATTACVGHVGELALFPLVVAVQLVLTLGFALILSALTVHFRDIRDILSNLLTFWFFATPIIYPYFLFEDPANPGLWQAKLLKLNPFTHLAISYQEILFFNGPVGHLRWLLMLGAISIVFFLFGYFVFDRLRDTFAEEV